jgi:hypothetical protein
MGSLGYVLRTCHSYCTSCATLRLGLVFHSDPGHLHLEPPSDHGTDQERLRVGTNFAVIKDIRTESAGAPRSVRDIPAS